MTLIQIVNMNERIEKLWTQAGGHYDSGNQHTWPQYTIDNPEKFVELIVLECATFIDSAFDIDEYSGEVVSYADGSQLKEHFGVEDPVEDPNLHTCPYAAEIHGDYETLCDCDEERTYQCAMDI